MEDSGDRRTEGKRREYKVLGDLDEDWYMGVRAQGTWKRNRNSVHRILRFHLWHSSR